MRRFSAIGVLTCLFLVVTLTPASAQVVGPICLGAGPPLNATLVLTLQVVAGTQFLVVGHIFGEEPVFGSGFVNGNQVRLAVASGPRGGMVTAPPLSLMALISLDPEVPGNFYCAGGTQCAVPTSLTLTIPPTCG